MAVHFAVDRRRTSKNKKIPAKGDPCSKVQVRPVKCENRFSSIDLNVHFHNFGFSHQKSTQTHLIYLLPSFPLIFHKVWLIFLPFLGRKKIIPVDVSTNVFRFRLYDRLTSPHKITSTFRTRPMVTYIFSCWRFDCVSNVWMTGLPTGETVKRSYYSRFVIGAFLICHRSGSAKRKNNNKMVNEIKPIPFRRVAAISCTRTNLVWKIETDLSKLHHRWHNLIILMSSMPLCLTICNIILFFAVPQSIR